MIVLLLIAIAVLLILLLVRRGGGGYRDREYDDVGPAQYYPQSGGFGAGSFLGGMATGALLTYLLEQGRIDMGQYSYFYGLDQQQMMDQLMQQNIIQQNEIDDLQQRLDGNDFANNGNNQLDGHNDGYRDDPYSDVNYDNNDNYKDNYNDNGGDGGWV